jgi:glycosyltransferase involved in cell wall biosynthesis
MKIVHVLSSLHKGGAETVMMELANSAVKVGHQVTVVAAHQTDSARLRKLFLPEVRVIYILDSHDSLFKMYFSLLIWVSRNISWLMGQDIIHCHLTYGAMFGSAVDICRKVLRKKKPKIVETYHAVGMPIPRLKKWLHSRLATHRDAFVLMAEDDYWRKFLADHPKLFSSVIPNGISISTKETEGQSQCLAYRREIGIPDDCRFVVGTIGMLRPDRQPWLYVPIFSEIARILGPDVHFVIGGSGSECDRVKSLVVQRGLQDRVHLPGLILNASLTRSIMDIYLTLNVGSLTGIAALEAASSSLPVLAIQLRSEYKCKPDDWIWSSNNPIELAEQVVKLIRSPTERQELSERQGTYVRTHHTTQAMANSYHSLYQTITT